MVSEKAHTGHYGDSGVQGHSAGGYFPVTIKTIGNPEPFAHVALPGGRESRRFESFSAAEDFALEVKRHHDRGEHAEVNLLFELNRGEYL